MYIYIYIYEFNDLVKIRRSSSVLTAQTAAALYCRKKLENLPRTDRQTHKQTNKQTENSNTETTLIPCGSSGRAGQFYTLGKQKGKKIRKFAENRKTDKQTNKQTENSITETTLIPCGSSGRAGQ